MKLKKIKPLYTKILCTANQYGSIQNIDGSELLDVSKQETGLKEYQTVLAVGNDVTTVKVGDLVFINPNDYIVKRYDKNSMKSEMNDVYNPVISFNFPIFEIDDKPCLLLKERDIDFIVEDYIEEDEIS